MKHGRYLAGIFAISVAALAPPTLSAATMSKDAVSKVVTDFSQAVGIKLETALNIKPPAPKPTGPQHYWRPFWRVSAGPNVSFEVVDGTGTIVEYDRKPGAGGEPAAQQPVGKPEAIAIASAFVDAAGQKTEMAPYPSVGAKPAGFYAKNFPACVLVSWARLCDGIPYHDDNVNVMIDAASGKVIRYAVNFHVPAPLLPTEAVTAQEAVKSAEEAVRAIAPPGDLTTLPPRKVIVQVDRTTKHQFIGRADHGAARVVWSCPFLASSNKVYEAWVDIESGDIVGGAISDVSPAAT